MQIYQISAVTDGGTTITFPATGRFACPPLPTSADENLGMSEVTFPIPAQTPSGQYVFFSPFPVIKALIDMRLRYLIRIEHIAIHSASYYGGAQVRCVASMLPIPLFTQTQFYIACAQVQVCLVCL